MLFQGRERICIPRAVLTFLLACPFSLQQEHVSVQGAFVHIFLDPLQGRETQRCSGNSFSGQTTERSNWKCKHRLWARRGPSGAAGSSKPWDSKQGHSLDVPEFLPVAAGRALQAAAWIAGDLWLYGEHGMQEFWHPEQNKLSQGSRNNWFANKGRVGSTGEAEEPRSCLLLCPTQDQLLSGLISLLSKENSQSGT